MEIVSPIAYFPKPMSVAISSVTFINIIITVRIKMYVPASETCYLLNNVNFIAVFHLKKEKIIQTETVILKYTVSVLSHKM